MDGKSIDLCLFDAFSNPRYHDPQKEEQLWAIREGVRRIDPNGYAWSFPVGRKEHECMRGCHIKPGDVYFKYAIGAGWGTDWKFCAACTAMIIYFLKVESLTAYEYSEWDYERKAPKCAESTWLERQVAQLDEQRPGWRGSLTG